MHRLGRRDGRARGGRGQGRDRRPARPSTGRGFDGVVVSPGVPLNRTRPHWPQRRARPACRSSATSSCSPQRAARAAAAQGRRHHRHQRQVDHDGADRPHPRTAGVPRDDGRQYRPADPRPGAAARGRRLRAGAVVLPARPDREPRRDVAVLLNITPDHLDRYDELRGYARVQGALVRRCSRPRSSARRSTAASTVCTTLRDRTGPCAEQRSPRHRRVISSSSRRHDRNRRLAGRCQGPHNAAERGRRRAACRALGIDDGDDRRGARRPIPACRTGWSGSPRRTACCSSTTARRPMPTRPRRRCAYPDDPLDPRRPSRRSGDLEPLRALFRPCRARPTRSARPGRCSRGCSRARCRSAECGTARHRRCAARARPRPQPGEVVLLSPACASFDQFATMRRAATRSVRAVEALA